MLLLETDSAASAQVTCQSAAGAICHVPCGRRTRWLNNHFGMLLEVFSSAANKHFLLLKC